MSDNQSDKPQYYYGRRQSVAYNHTGQPNYRYEDLTPDDFLSPQEGDLFTHGDRHDSDVRHAVRLFKTLYRDDPTRTVFSALPMAWPQPEVHRPAPDLAIIPNVCRPDRPRALFDLHAEGTGPEFILEVVSPRLAMQDLEDKMQIYARNGVPEYFILDSGMREHDDSTDYRILGYHLHLGKYEPVEADDAGRLFSEANNIWLALENAVSGHLVVRTHTGAVISPQDEDSLSSSQLRSQGEIRAKSIADALDILA